jgi:hypothetical protein
MRTRIAQQAGITRPESPKRDTGYGCPYTNAAGVTIGMALNEPNTNAPKN